MMMYYDDDMKRRLRRAEGQIRGVLKMMEEGKHCKDVVTQLSAIRSAVDKTIAHVVAVNLEKCIIEQQELGQGTHEVVREAVQLLIKSR